jgi:hypothetical protein
MGEEEKPKSEISDLFTLITGKVVSGILSPDENTTWRDHVRRLWIGAAGGLFYACLKNYFGAGIGVYGILIMDPTSPRRGELMFGYIAGFFVSGIIGGVVAWLSAQKTGRLLFLIGMFGVQILLTLSPILQSRRTDTGSLLREFQIVTPAYAAQDIHTCVGDSAFAKGFKAFFGLRDHFDKYAVVVASGKSVEDAKNKMDDISAKSPSLTLRIGPRPCDNDYYPVLATDYLPLDEAKAALDKIRKSSGVTDAFLSPGPLPP